MKALFVQPDQLTTDTALFDGCSPDSCVVVMLESIEEFTRVPFHRQRLVLVFAAMRHFAEELRDAGYTVEYHRCCGDPAGKLRETACAHSLDRARIMASADWGASDRYRALLEEAGLRVEGIPNDLFINTRQTKPVVLQRGRATRMETFYRKVRAATGLLMDGPEPAGGKWNYDHENRKPPARGLESPPIPRFKPDAITRRVMEDVTAHFPKAFGRLDEFHWPVTRRDAQELLDDFFQWRFPAFGDYQDAMVAGNDTLFHALVSACLNIGLLDPEAVCREAESHYRAGRVPLNAAEGFIRQIAGWREFVYALYRANMPGYDTLNHLEADMPLPGFYWSGETRMRCVAEALRPVLNSGLNHHIQRLMVTGNFALLAGVRPQDLNDWYWLAYIDAWHWVVTPNVIGMAAHADGGLMASKPYAASANYINTMSNYCKHCPYNPKTITGENACPFNALYWDFLDRHQARLARNPRMALSYRNLDRKDPAERRAIRKQADATRQAALNDTL
ncbi:MAG: cryptochrome/photolyase family protein [Candidatus Hydrogenedentes bacterium]|nr:cryptochrome/photolyase family protein [Candidatus Hydrogenedentota bacterium]